MENREFTEDTFFNGRVMVRQFKYGYRFSVDAVILSHYAAFSLVDSSESVVDLGTGCGIIPLLMAYRLKETRFVGIEIQDELAGVAMDNIESNGMTGRIEIQRKDIRIVKAHEIKGPVKMVVSNPPYRKKMAGRINPDEQKAIARHEIKVTLDEIICCASRLLNAGGKFMLIYPSERMAALIAKLSEFRMEPKLIRFIHSKPSADAKLVLVEATKLGKPGVRIFPPLCIYEEDGRYTPLVEAMFIP